MKNIISMVFNSSVSSLNGAKLWCNKNINSLILMGVIGLFYKAMDKGYAINASIPWVDGEKVEVNFTPVNNLS